MKKLRQGLYEEQVAGGRLQVELVERKYGGVPEWGWEVRHIRDLWPNEWHGYEEVLSEDLFLTRKAALGYGRLALIAETFER